MSSGEREVEAKLAIVSQKPREVVEEVAALSSLGRFRLVSRGTLSLRDSYLDREDGALRRAGASLRIRTAGEERWITLKGASEKDAGMGMVERDELELPWSMEALERIVAALAGLGVRLRPSGGVPDGEPLEALGALGLSVVQDRATKRRVRDVVADGAEEPIAELVVDSVRYDFGGRAAWHHEVEVEAKGAGVREVVGEVAEALLARFPEVLRPWTRGKLSTGRAVERLLREGDAEGVLGPDGDLTPAAYERIARE